MAIKSTVRYIPCNSIEIDVELKRIALNPNKQIHIELVSSISMTRCRLFSPEMSLFPT